MREITRARQFIFLALARLNPALPPRRRRTTAKRHLIAINRVARLLNDVSWGDLESWAALTVLEASATLHPLGGVRWRGEDYRNGVMRHTLQILAEAVVNGSFQRVTDMKIRAHMIAFSSIWWAVEYHDLENVKSIDGERTVLDTALEAMELCDPPGSVYWLQVPFAPPAYKRAIEEVCGYPVPTETETNFIADDGKTTITVDEEGRITLDIERDTPLNLDLIVDMLGELPVTTIREGDYKQPHYEGPATGLLNLANRVW